MSNGTITMTGAEYDALAGRIATLESENAKLRAELGDGTTGNKYRAELYDEVLQKARDMGYGNVTMALDDLIAMREHLTKLRAELERRAVPDVSAMARVLSDRAASACCVDPDDNWKVYGQEFIDDVRAMLAAAPSAPKADDPVKVQLLEALESLILHANPALFSQGQLEQSKRAIAAARKGEGE